MARRNLLLRSLAVSVCICCACRLHAGGVTDGSVGPRRSLSGSFVVGAELGRQRGGNLYHSFSSFGLNPGESATFTGPSNVQNVIARVTGGEASTIDGTLACEIPNANLYF